MVSFGSLLMVVVPACIIMQGGIVTAASATENLRPRRSSDSTPLYVVTETLSRQVNAILARLTALEAKNAKLVAFHAWSDSHTLANTSRSTIPLSHVHTNIGDGYDISTGIFTAPLAGTYHFTVTFMAFHSFINMGLYAADTLVAESVSDSMHSGSYDNSAIAATVHLDQGQEVKVSSKDVQAGGTLLGDQYITFAGFLVRAD